MNYFFLPLSPNIIKKPTKAAVKKIVVITSLLHSIFISPFLFKSNPVAHVRTLAIKG